ncbi:MAG: fibronectin type III domain-containing protein [Acidobacteria bacterium]|nr:fibronectin type III domain-containing protein [Acidobacteriota bacterium]
MNPSSQIGIARRAHLAGAFAAVAGLVLALSLLLATAAPGAEAQGDIPLEPDELGLDPLPGGGVTGFLQPSVAQNWRVHAFAEIGDRIFVGGAFLNVTELPYAGSPSHDQAFIAAFDRNTNAFIETWTPVLDDAVWALVEHNGLLIVGGEFDTVNGVAREGLVALDPITGATVSEFAASIGNVGSTYEASVRALEIVGNQLYVVGDYNRLVDAKYAHGRYRTARVDATTGKVDKLWIPHVSGGGVFDIAVDPVHDKIYLVGTFTSASAQPDTKSMAVVNSTDGAVIPGHPAHLNTSWSKTYGVDVVGDEVFIGGEQHFMQVRDATTWAFKGCAVTGFSSVNPSTCGLVWTGGSGSGGDYQVVQEMDGIILGGCHCRGNHWNSVTQTMTNLDDRGFRLYDEGLTEHDFMPNATHWNEGPYAAFTDSTGCLYIGGDFTGEVDGFARYCRKVSAPTNVNASLSGSSVAISWSASETTNPGIETYRIMRDGVQIADTSALNYTDWSVTTGSNYSYTVIAKSINQVSSPHSAPATVTTLFEGVEKRKILPISERFREEVRNSVCTGTSLSPQTRLDLSSFRNVIP